VVEGIECIDPELQLEPLGKREVLVEAQVDIDIARAIAITAGFVPDCAELEPGQRKCSGIDDLWPARTGVATRPRYDIRPVVGRVTSS
jgi:hypothetical protein